MFKISVKDAILLNLFVTVVFAVIVGVWSFSAVVNRKAESAFQPKKYSVGDALYKTGNYELLRNSAVDCETSFDQLVLKEFNTQASNDWTMAFFAACAIAVFLFNVWFLRGIRSRT